MSAPTRLARAALAALTSMAALGACGGYDAPTGTSPVGRIDVSPAIAVIGVGEMVTLQIAAFDTLGEPTAAGLVVSHSNRQAVQLEVLSSTAVRAIGLAPGLDRVTVRDQYLQTGSSALIRVTGGTP